MGWQLILPPRQGRHSPDGASIVLRVNKDGSCSAQMHLGQGLVKRLGRAWAVGAKLEVSLGTGADHGRLRLMLSDLGDHLLANNVGPRAAHTRSVLLGRQVVWTKKNGKHAIRPEEIELEDGMITVTLPPEVLSKQATRSEG